MENCFLRWDESIEQEWSGFCKNFDGAVKLLSLLARLQPIIRIVGVIPRIG
jgi:hypothetical protein